MNYGQGYDDDDILWGCNLPHEYNFFFFRGFNLSSLSRKEAVLIYIFALLHTHNWKKSCWNVTDVVMVWFAKHEKSNNIKNCLRVGRSLESLASSHASPLNMGYLMPYSYHNGMAALTSLPSMVSPFLVIFVLAWQREGGNVDVSILRVFFFLFLGKLFFFLLWLFEARNWCFPPVEKKRMGGGVAGFFLFRGFL